MVFGLALVVGTSALVVAMSWRFYKTLADPNECRVLEAVLKSGLQYRAPQLGASRPGLLLKELALVADSPERQVAAFNDALAEVDSSTQVGRDTSKLFARVAFLAGMAGGAAELAGSRTSIRIAGMWALAAVFIGVLGAAACAVIGHVAMAGFSRRRQLWDEFVRWILNSQYPRTELNVSGVHRRELGGVGQEDSQQR